MPATSSAVISSRLRESQEINARIRKVGHVKKKKKKKDVSKKQ